MDAKTIKSELIKLAAKIVVCPSEHDPWVFHYLLPKTTPVTARRLIFDALSDMDKERKTLSCDIVRLANMIKGE